MEQSDRVILLRRGQRLEYTTLGWNIVGVVVLAWTAFSARSVALAGFGLDSVIEIGASTVVIWELRGTNEGRRHRALQLIGAAFAMVALYLMVQGVVVLADSYHAGHSNVGLAWTALTAVVMVFLSRTKATTGRALGNPVLISEGRVTMIDAVLAASVFLGMLLNATLHWWWADPAAGFVLVFYATKECRSIYRVKGEHV